MQKVTDWTIYVYWSGPKLPEKIADYIENNVKVNSHMNFVLCYHKDYVPKDDGWDEFIKKLHETYDNFRTQDIHGCDVLNPAKKFLPKEYI